jgi:ketosteroid isomerase-like protein
MKQLIFFSTIITLLLSCNSSVDKTKTENLAIARMFLKAVENKDVLTMDSLLAENYKGFGPSFGDSVNKEEALNSFKYNAENLYESMKYNRFQNIAVSVKPGEEALEGDWVANWAEITIKYKDGRGPVVLWVNSVYKMENGKITISRTFYNEADALRQLGYEFIPPMQK